jgi:hypothetical protein
MHAQTLQSYDYTAYIGAMRPITPMMPVQLHVQHPIIPSIQTYNQDYELAGLLPTIFAGKRTDSNRFLKEFKQWWLLNQNCTEMKQAYNRVLMALNYIKGPKVDDWQEAQLTKLELDNRNYNDVLWLNLGQVPTRVQWWYSQGHS